MENDKKINAKLCIFVAGFAVFLATFNETFLNIAFNGIGQSLNVQTSLVQWLATAYMLGASVMVPVSAFLYRRVRTKVLFTITVCLLIVGSVVGGLADNFTVLLVGRIIQSLGSGMLVPICMNIALAVAPKSKLGFYMGLMGAMTTLGPSLSIIISGLLLSVADWHKLLWTFGGLSCLLLIFAICFLGNIATLSKPKLDVLSVVLISFALIGILYGISTILSGSILYACIALVVGILCCGLFVIRQNKIEEPLINLQPLKVPQFAICVCLNMLALCIVFAMNILLPMYLQDYLGATEFNSSLALFPAIFLCCIMSPIAGKIYDKFGVKLILPLGFVLMCLFGVGIGLLGSSNTILSIALMYVPIILGSAFIIGPAQTFALSHLTMEENGAGVTILSTGFQIAGCIGSSVFINLYAMMLGERNELGKVADLAKCNHSLLICMIVVACVAFVGAVLAFIVGRLKKKETNQSAINENLNIDKNAQNNLICNETRENVGDVKLADLREENVFVVHKNDSLLKAMQLMTEKQIGGLPIVDDNGVFVGFISDGDIVRYLSNTYPLFLNAYSFATMAQNDKFDEKLKELISLNVCEIASSRKIFVKSNDDLNAVCKILSDNKIKKVPVLNDNGQIVGIINSSSITKFAINVCLKKYLNKDFN